MCPTQILMLILASGAVSRGIGVNKAMMEGGGGVLVTECPVLAPLLQRGPCLLTVKWHHRGASRSPFLGTWKFCTQRPHSAPISRSEWTQHFSKSLTRLDRSAISCQSAHAHTGSKPRLSKLQHAKTTSYTTIVCTMEGGTTKAESRKSEKKLLKRYIKKISTLFLYQIGLEV